MPLTVQCATWRTPWRNNWVQAGFDRGYTGMGLSSPTSHTDHVPSDLYRLSAVHQVHRQTGGGEVGQADAGVVL